MGNFLNGKSKKGTYFKLVHPHIDVSSTGRFEVWSMDDAGKYLKDFGKWHCWSFTVKIFDDAMTYTNMSGSNGCREILRYDHTQVLPRPQLEKVQVDDN